MGCSSPKVVLYDLKVFNSQVVSGPMSDVDYILATS